MKIDKLTPGGVTGPIGEGRRTARSNSPAATTPAPAAARSDDEVTLNPLSLQMKSAEEALDKVPVVDSAKVEEIKAAIREGRFQINTDVIADKLLASVKELVLTQKD